MMAQLDFATPSLLTHGVFTRAADRMHDPRCPSVGFARTPWRGNGCEVQRDFAARTPQNGKLGERRTICLTQALGLQAHRFWAWLQYIHWDYGRFLPATLS